MHAVYYLCWLNIHIEYLLYKFCATVAVYNESDEGYHEAVHNHLLNVYWIKDYIKLELKGMKDAFCVQARKVQIPLKKWWRRKLLQEAKQNCFSSPRILAPWRNWGIVMKGSKCLNERCCRKGGKMKGKWIGSPPIKYFLRVYLQYWVSLGVMEWLDVGWTRLSRNITDFR
jgi:hypothetical protein